MRITRRTHFALPLVLVVGCGSSPRSPTPESPGPTEQSLPPAPGSGKVTKTASENGNTLLTYESGDRVYVHPDGTCHAEYSVDCGPYDPATGPSTCNPPPPQQVQCPTDAK